MLLNGTSQFWHALISLTGYNSLSPPSRTSTPTGYEANKLKPTAKGYLKYSNNWHLMGSDNGILQDPTHRSRSLQHPQVLECTGQPPHHPSNDLWITASTMFTSTVKKISSLEACTGRKPQRSHQTLFPPTIPEPSRPSSTKTLVNSNNNRLRRRWPNPPWSWTVLEEGKQKMIHGYSNSYISLLPVLKTGSGS